MKFPAFIEKKNDTWCLSFVDVPGCQVTANSVNETMDLANQNLAEHFAILAEYGETIPNASSMDEALIKVNQNNVIWGIIDFDITPYLGKSHKINVTLPEILIKQIDDRVSKSEHYKTRSGFIATACIQELSKKK